jgi:alginate O-acetyltransferase complex protein AlgI
VLLLALFKYYTFFTGKELTGIIAPAGISYIVFTQIAWLTDSFRGETINTSFPDYLNFILFFPKVLLGPIETHKDLIPALNDDKKSRIDYENMCRGLLLFTAGMAKKLLLEPVFAGGADFGFNSPDLLTLPVAWASSFAYTIQLYLDFSGYCDMAAGLALFFNLDIIQNFNSPYKAVSVNDFWKRWHISLTSFLRKYIYFPLGGSKKGTVRTYVNIMIIYLISGFWHGAGLNFIFFGVLLFLFLKVGLRSGKVLGVYLVYYSIVRFILEYFRGDAIRGGIGVLSTSQIISIILLPIGIFLTYKAATDSALLNPEAWVKQFDRLKEWTLKKAKQAKRKFKANR